jgi:cellulose synthase/poly-beta-1,6-N-acetylglucosamine synthase-like glycosyltransferase
MTAQGTVARRDTAVLTRAVTVSALVPAWNESDRIGGCIESLLQIDNPPLEIFVSAGGDDGTWEIASQFTGDRLTVVRQEPGEGKQRALRNLLRYARGDILYLTDGDSRVSADTFRQLLEPIIAGEAEVVTGSYRPYDDELDRPFVLYQWSIDREVDRHRTPRSEGISGANTAITRRALLASGAFDADVPTGTDYHLARQLRGAGIDILYIDAPVETQYATSADVFMNRRARWLRNTMMHGLRFNDLGEIKATAATLTLGAGACLAPLSWRWTKRAGVGTWLLGLSYLLFLRQRYAAALAHERGLSMGFGYYCRLPWYTLLEQLVAIRALTDMLRPNRRWRW